LGDSNKDAGCGVAKKKRAGKPLRRGGMNFRAADGYGLQEGSCGAQGFLQGGFVVLFEEMAEVETDAQIGQVCKPGEPQAVRIGDRHHPLPSPTSVPEGNIPKRSKTSLAKSIHSTWHAQSSPKHSLKNIKKALDSL
jgi:hypothetical protein